MKMQSRKPPLQVNLASLSEYLSIAGELSNLYTKDLIVKYKNSMQFHQNTAHYHKNIM